MTYIPTVHVASNYTLHEPADIAAAYQIAVGHLFGVDGMFAYRAFDHINATFFDGKLPMALILWDITQYGRCLGWCRSSDDGPPIIKLHPSLVNPTTACPWNIPRDQLGYCQAYDVLLHECIHASVQYTHGGYEKILGVTSSWTSHNNPIWIGECNRIARILGYTDVDIQMSKSRRVPNPGDGPKTRVKRVNDGTSKPERFPHNLSGRSCFYRANQLPFELQS